LIILYANFISPLTKAHILLTYDA